MKGADRNGNQAGDADLVEVQALVCRVVGARVRDPDTVDDVVQETLARILVARGRLDDCALAPYAVVTARNLVRSLGREDERRRRHSHRLFEGATAPAPEDEVVQEEERTALAMAWSKLSPDERGALRAHEVEGTGVAELAQDARSTPGAVAVRLARTRATLRVEYLLALRRVELPTADCRPVLLAISSRDQRRQKALAVGDHLLHCECCASLSEPLVERSRPLAVLWPLLAAGRLLEGLGRRIATAGRWARGHPVPTIGAGAGVAVATVSILMFIRPDDTAWLRSGGRSLLPPPAASELQALATRPVEARSVRVQSVVAPTGFWVGTSQRDRIFVEIGETPPFPVTVGERVSFVGYIDTNHPGSIERYGLVGQDAAQLRDEGYHLHVEASALRRH